MHLPRFNYTGFCRLPGVLSAYAAKRVLEERLDIIFPASRLAPGQREPNAPQP